MDMEFAEAGVASAVPADTGLLVLVRHGERLDEADPMLWRRMTGTGDVEWHDPPLTERGVRQAAAAGAGLAKELGGLPGAEAVFASPSLRTLGTAAAIAAALGAKLVPVTALYGCAAAAKMSGLAKLKM